MEIYIMRSISTGNYQRLHKLEEDWRDKLLWFKGDSHIVDWKPLRVYYNKDDVALPRSDSPYLSPDVQIFNVFAYEHLIYLCEKYGEFLPLAPDDLNLVLYNVTNVIDAFDKDRSIVTRGQRTGIITSFRQYVFHPDIVGSNHIFKIPDDRQTSIFVTNTFKNEVNHLGLTGFDFRPVWSI